MQLKENIRKFLVDGNGLTSKEAFDSLLGRQMATG